MGVLYIDVTNLVKNPESVTLVQRVEREVISRIILDYDIEVALLAYDDGKEAFRIVNKNAFLDVFFYNKKCVTMLLSEELLSLRNIQNGSVFFDIENVESNSLKRGFLYPLLREKKVRIATFIYDLIPISNPNYCDSNKVLNFIQYFGAVLQYSNRIITCSQVNIDIIVQLENQLQLPPVDKCLVRFGTDFHLDDNLPDQAVSEKIEAIARTDYILVPGTFEPRKNHTIILDAIDDGLSEVDVVFCGRYGRDSLAIRKRIEKQAQENPHFHFLMNPNSTELKYLYEHALATVTAAFDEGYSLPVVDSLQIGTPVIASDIAIFHEIGGDFLQYFTPDDTKQFTEVIRSSILDAEAYSEIRSNLVHFAEYKWSESARVIINAAITA